MHITHGIHLLIPINYGIELTPPFKGMNLAFEWMNVDLSPPNVALSLPVQRSTSSDWRADRHDVNHFTKFGGISSPSLGC